ncbi:hypothetical protein K470DRAFT_177511 [Piedraia hortae CBS 480.64]|uniref:Uncharacterized protein n=1 Tax=Piedraia hortae CBS 480.64 TaxID=1314780 RepID=A0A6A7BPT7_9PEZI|nr:hypothetical protein K470DRAFT_177511 [Piedraia hortae CBS 480.64]
MTQAVRANCGLECIAAMSLALADKRLFAQATFAHSVVSTSALSLIFPRSVRLNSSHFLRSSLNCLESGIEVTLLRKCLLGHEIASVRTPLSASAAFFNEFSFSLVSRLSARRSWYWWLRLLSQTILWTTRWLKTPSFPSVNLAIDRRQGEFP